MSNHAHKIMAGVVMEAEGHSHDITMMGVPIHDMEEGEVVNERPMSPSEEEAMSNSKSEDVVETKAEEMELRLRKPQLRKKWQKLKLLPKRLKLKLTPRK